MCKLLFVPSKTGVCFPKSHGSPIIKSHWPLRSDSLGIPSPFVIWPDMGFRIFITEGELLWYYCSPGFGSPTQWVWGFILSWFTPPTVLLWLLLCLWMWGIFLVGSSVLLSMVVQPLVAILVLSQEEMSAHPSTLPSWTRSSGNGLYLGNIDNRTNSLWSWPGKNNQHLSGTYVVNVKHWDKC